jgi:hypothetical protein
MGASLGAMPVRAVRSARGLRAVRRAIVSSSPSAALRELRPKSNGATSLVVARQLPHESDIGFVAGVAPFDGAVG